MCVPPVRVTVGAHRAPLRRSAGQPKFAKTQDKRSQGMDIADRLPPMQREDGRREDERNLEWKHPCSAVPTLRTLYSVRERRWPIQKPSCAVEAPCDFHAQFSSDAARASAALCGQALANIA